MKLPKKSLKDALALGLHPPTIPVWIKDIDTRKGRKPDVVAVDTECTGLNWSKEHRPFAISMAWYDPLTEEMRQAYYDWPVDPFTRMPQYSIGGTNLFTSYWCDPSITKVFANAKYDLHMLDQLPFIGKPRGKIEDVLVMAWCCNTMELSYRLNDLAEKYLGVTQTESVLLKKKVQEARNSIKGMGYNAGPNISQIAQDYWLLKFLDHNDKTCEIYALKDAGPRTLDLYYFYQQALDEPSLRETYDREMQVMHPIYAMECRGIRFHEKECLKTNSSTFHCINRMHYLHFSIIGFPQ